MNTKKYAQLIVDYCLDVQENQQILVRSTPIAQPLLADLQAEILTRGATVEFLMTFEGQQSGFHTHSVKENEDYISVFYQHAVTHFDAVINIMAPYNKSELKNISAEKRRVHLEALAPVKKQFMARSAAGELKWVLAVFPNAAMAQDSGMSLADYTQFIESACFLDTPEPAEKWQALSRQQEKWVARLNQGTTIQFIGKDTDITFNLTGRTWINSDGKRNMPSGEVFTSPVENSGNGVVTFDVPTRYQGIDVEGIRLVVKDGEVVEWSARVGQEALDSAFSLKGARFFGEIAIGTNSLIQTPTKEILFDEKIGGTVHMAVGASYPETGGKNESALHWDMIKWMKQDSQILLDGEIVYQNGSFLNG